MKKKELGEFLFGIKSPFNVNKSEFAPRRKGTEIWEIDLIFLQH